MKNLLIICVVAFGFIACEKQAGEGGTSVIEGGLIYFTVSFNTITLQNDTHYYPKAGKDIFIIYANDESDIFDDKTESDWSGKYHFEYLRKGDYTIYTHIDTTIETGPESSITYDLPVFKHIKITSNNSTNTVDDFIIEKNQ